MESTLPCARSSAEIAQRIRLRRTQTVRRLFNLDEFDNALTRAELESADRLDRLIGRVCVGVAVALFALIAIGVIR